MPIDLSRPGVVTSSKRHSRRRRPSLLRRIVLPATVWLWGCIVPPLLYAATPQEQKYEQSGGVAPSPQAIASAEPTKSARVTAITSSITVDGLLDEQVWQTAPTIGELTQREPRTGDAPTEKTAVTLLRDDNNLYIGVICDDSEPRRVIGTQMVRDANLGSDDRITILLDTYGDQRNAFYFSTNPAGALVDGLVFANGQSNLEWDSVWTVRTRRTDRGWTAEFAIPFKSLSFPSGRAVWGFNIARTIQRKLEEDRWSGAHLETDLFQVSEAGQITNLGGLTQGIGLDVRPFDAGRWLHLGANGHDTVTGKPGLDMFYNFTPSLKLSATVNTDFGETEVDARQINLSRFSLLFPEKRSFFLEDAGVFSFASTGLRNPGGIPDTGAELLPFFSRQIGLLAGEEVPIDFGMKLTGKVGRSDLGVLDVRTGDLPIVPGKNFFVGRVKRNLMQQSYIGAIVTQGNPAGSLTNNTVGADVRLATSQLLGKSRNLVFNAYALKSTTEAKSGKDWSYGVSAQYPNDKVIAQFIWKDIQDNFDPALGFVQRRNTRLLRVGASYNPRPKNFLNIQQMFHDLFFTRFARPDNGQVESWDLYATVLDWHFKSGDAVHSIFDINPTYERLFQPFPIFPGVVLPPGEYQFTRWRFQAATAQKRRLQGSVNWAFGTYWSGHADELIATLQYKIPPRFTIGLNINHTFARLPQGHFAARIMSVQANYAVSPFLTFSNLIQYDNLSRNLGWQSRVRWILEPGNDLFFVFNQGWIQDALGGFRFGAEDRKVSAKFQYAFRF